jgi:hypothetical protein
VCVGEIIQEQADRVEGSTKAPDHLGLVFLHVGTAFVTPAEGQLYDPTDGAVTVPIEGPDDPWGPFTGIVTPAVSPAAKDALVKPTVKSAAIASLVVIMISLLCP